MSEIVYVLTNEAMPGIVKIGRTTDSVQSRVRSLFNTNLPLPFECPYAAEVHDAVVVGRVLHQLFGDHRVSPNREFFRLAPEKVVIALRLAPHKNVTPGEPVFESPSDAVAVLRARERRSRIDLAAIGVLDGATLTFSRDENVTATVVGESRVLFHGDVMSLSAAALKAVQDAGLMWKAVSGSDVWLYEGETLDERRRRIEEERFATSGDEAS